MKNINKKGVLIYLYYKKISDKINKNYKYEIIKFNNQVILTYFKTKPIHKKTKYKYIILSAKVKNLDKYLNKDWSPTYKYTENIDFLYVDGRYKNYSELYNIKTKYSTKVILDNKFNIINKIDLYDYIKKKDIYFYSTYLPEQYIYKNNWKEIEQNFKNNKFWIVKPEVGSGGFGIKVFSDLNKMKKYITEFKNNFEVSYSKKKKNNNWIIQKYIDNPLLINNKKFHIRFFYVVIKKNNKLETYFFKKGLIYVSGKDFTMNNLSFNIHNSHGKTTKKKDASLFPDKIKELYGEENSNKSTNDIIKIFDFIRSNIKIDCYKESKNSMFIYGVDIMITNDFNAKLIEINNNTGLLTGMWFMKLKNIFYKDLFKLFLYDKQSTYFIKQKFELYDFLFSRYRVTIPKNSIISWCIIYEILYKCKIKFYGLESTYLNLCSDEEATGYAIDFYFYNIHKIINKLSNNISLNLNYKLNTLNKIEYFKKKHKNIDIIIYNCYPEFDLEKKYINILSFGYHIDNHNIYELQFNYTNNNKIIITMYYNKSLVKILNNNNNNKNKNNYKKTKEYSELITRNNDNHKYKLHKKFNPLDHHSHKKINIEDEKKYIDDLFKIFKIDNYHKQNIYDSKKKYFEGITGKIQYKNAHSNLIIDENKNKNNSKSKKISILKSKEILNNPNIKNYKFIIGSLILCNKGGTLIIRYTLPFTKIIDNNIIYLLKKCFKSIKFYDGQFTKELNYIFLVCKKYIGYKKAKKIINIKKIYKNIENLLSKNLFKEFNNFNEETNDFLTKVLKKKIKNKKKNKNKENLEIIIEKWFLKNKIQKRNKEIKRNKEKGYYIKK